MYIILRFQRLEGKQSRSKLGVFLHINFCFYLVLYGLKKHTELENDKKYLKLKQDNIVLGGFTVHGSKRCR